MSGLVDAQIGDVKEEVCEGEVKLVCDKPISGNKVSDSVISKGNVLFPNGISEIPWGGGAIVKIPASTKLDFSLPPAVISLLKSDVRAAIKIKETPTNITIQKKLELLGKIQLTVSGYLGKFRNVIFQGHKKQPRFGMAIVQNDSKNSSKYKKKNFCEFKFIPLDVFKEIAASIDVPFSGISGFGYKNELASLTSSDEDICKLLFEFAPVINFSKAQILNGRSTYLGGYYTANENGDLFFKTPDLSGCNSSGIGSDFYSENDLDLSINLFYKGAYSEIIVSEPKVPISSSLLTKDIRYNPDDNELKVYFDAFKVDKSKILSCYLSVVNKSIASSSEVKTLQGVRANLVTTNLKKEEFTFPTLTKSFLSGGKPFISYEESKSYITSYYSEVNSYFDIDELVGNDNLDIPASGLSSSNYLGVKNRPDILLSRGIDSLSHTENDRAYFSDLSPATYYLLSSIMPKVCGDFKPNAWIKNSSIGQDDVGIYALFSLSDVVKKLKKSDSKLDVSMFALDDGQISFSLYVEDGYRQISRSYGENLLFKNSIPTVTLVAPSGYSDSVRIDLTDNTLNQITLTGSGLSEVTSIDLVNADGQVVLTAREGDSFYTTLLSVQDSTVYWSFIPMFLALSLNLSVSSEFFVVVNTRGRRGVRTDARINFSPNSEVPLPEKIFIDLDLSVDQFSANVTNNIPIGINSSKIKLTSKNNQFADDLFCYVATKDKESYSSFLRDENTLTLNHEGKQLYVLDHMEFELTRSRADDFYRKNDETAILSFPGKYSKYNLSSLVDKDFCLVFTRKSIREYSVDNVLNQESISNKYSLIDFGNSTQGLPGFVGDPKILGFAASYGSGIDVKLIKDPILSNEFEELKTFQNVVSKDINISKKADVFYILFSGPNYSDKRIEYSFFFGGKNITPKLISTLDPGGKGSAVSSLKERNIYVAKFENIDYKEESIANVYISINDKRTDHKASSNVVSLKATYFIPCTLIPPSIVCNNFSVDDNSGNLIITESVSITEYDSFFKNCGVIYKDVQDSQLGDLTWFEFYNAVSLSTSVKLSAYLQTKGGSESDVILLPSQSLDDVVKIRANPSTFSIAAGSVFSPSEYVKVSDGYLVFSNVTVSNPSTVKFDYPAIISVNGIATSGNEVLFSADYLASGNTIMIEAENTGEEFIVMIGDTEFTAISVEDKNGKKQFSIQIPDEKLSLSLDCQKICISKANVSYNSSLLSLGNEALAFLGTNIVEQLGGYSRNLPDAGEEKDKLASAPVRFFNTVFRDANVQPEIFNSFCDLSYAITANLQLSLSTFKTYLVPVKVIFCIIDVICSLVNPVKLARAVIRLFQCIIDLIALLPQVSVPIMFLQLALHLLELLGCVVPKIMGYILTINNIISAIEIAVVSKKYQALASLEGSLDTYIKNVEIDLQFIDPITQCLGIFLELLELVFSFSCITSNGEDVEYACGIDPTLLAGIVGGTIAPEDDILPNALIPVAQPYTTESIEDASASSDGSKPFEMPDDYAGNTVATLGSDGTYLSSMDVDLDSLRNVSPDFSFPVTFAPTITRSRKRRKNIVRFLFNQRGDGGKRIIDPDQTLDAPLVLLSEGESNAGKTLKIRESGSTGSFRSPLDGFSFTSFVDGTGSVKPLDLTFELPEYSFNETTGELIQTGTTIVNRTFDDIPSMCIMDEEFNMYFIEPGGITLKEDGGFYYVDNILTKLVNLPAATKLKFSKEEVVIDTDEDGTLEEGGDDDTINIYDFPQIYFVDMRQCKDQIQQACFNTSINSFMLENQTDDIRDIVQESKECVDSFISTVKTTLNDVKTSVSSGRIPQKISIGLIESANQTLVDCVTKAADDICKYAINPLSTSFMLEDDSEIVALPQYPDVSLQGAISDGEEDEPPFIGAAEYASGIGDSIQVPAGTNASILIIPRDAYNQVVETDLSSKISLEIISDDTGSARIEDISFSRNNYEYRAKITADGIGAVKVRAKICQRTVQAITYAGLDVEETTDAKVDCVDDVLVSATEDNIPFGALTKVDRILTIFFTKGLAIIENTSAGADELATTNPQVFGTELGD